MLKRTRVFKVEWYDKNTEYYRIYFNLRRAKFKMFYLHAIGYSPVLYELFEGYSVKKELKKYE